LINEGCKKTKFAKQDMCGLPKTFRLAQKMGKSLG
jgi:hypothetical protein